MRYISFGSRIKRSTPVPGPLAAALVSAALLFAGSGAAFG